MIIDWHMHVHDPKDAEGPHWKGRCPMTIENVIRAHDEVHLDRSVISNALPYTRNMNPGDVLAAMRSSHDYLARCRDRYPQKVVPMATCFPGAADEYLREFERSVREDGMRAVMMPSSYKGQYPDADAVLPFFELAVALDVPVFIHPGEVSPENMGDYRLTSGLGRPQDTCLALARMIVRGVFERVPDLKLVAAHLGGGICEKIGRLDFGYNMMDELFFLGPFEPMLIKHAPSHYLKMIYFDSACYHAPAARLCVDTVGADRFLLGTDAPPLMPLKRSSLDIISEIGLSEADKAKVLGGNAKALLKI